MAKEKKEETAVNTDKLKALQAAMEKIEKSYGKGAIMTLGNDHIENIEVIPTGSIGLNAALGVGGYPRGRVVEIYGPELTRSEERRVGKECRSRWSPYH